MGQQVDRKLSFTLPTPFHTLSHLRHGQNAEVELKPGGRLISVTNDNVVEYIHRVADYRCGDGGGGRYGGGPSYSPAIRLRRSSPHSSPTSPHTSPPTHYYDRLNRQPRGPTAAFLKGFFAMVRPEWVAMFNSGELQLLIGGSEEGFDLQDMRANTQYAGAQTESVI